MAPELPRLSFRHGRTRFRSISSTKWARNSRRSSARQFGKDGFEDAVAQIGQVEAALGYADLAGFNAPPPPKT
jgi:hypothetical protein